MLEWPAPKIGAGHFSDLDILNMARTKLIKSYVTANEKKALQALAKRLGISVSEVVRRAATGARLPDMGRYEAVRDLVKINADLARLGNLLKLGIDEETLDHESAMELLADIRMRQGDIKAAIKQM